MNELSNKIAEIIQRICYEQGGEIQGAHSAADDILDIPEIRAALQANQSASEQAP